jgi:hypothetical protein
MAPENKIENALNVLVFLAVCATIFYYAKSFWELANQPATKIEVQYDCRLAEISVDYPAEVKQRCRELLKPKLEVTRE